MDLLEQRRHPAEVAAARRQVAERGDLVQIGAGAKRDVARSAQHHHAHAWVGRALGKRLAQLRKGRAIESIADLRPVDRYRRDRFASADQQVLEVHTTSILGRRAGFYYRARYNPPLRAAILGRNFRTVSPKAGELCIA